MNDSSLHDLWSRSTAGRAAPHPSREQLVGLADGSLAAADRDQVIDHLTACSDCAVLVKTLREQHSALAEVASRRAPPAWGLRAAAVLVGAALLVGALLIMQSPRERAPVLRSEPETSGLTALVEDDVSLPRDRFVLRWSAPPEARTFTVTLLTTGLAVVHRATGIEAHQYQIPAGALAKIGPGTRLLWTVETVTTSGQRLISTAAAVQID